MKTLYRLIALTILFLFGQAQTFAQCAMCRATVETNLSSGESSVGAGLNTGILYLMMMPYILIATIAWFWYKSYQKNKKRTSQINDMLNPSV
ncbi:hypothetical protein [Sediminitomix flava]|uniref:Uncharacterized protein n=1 Tax=Sediminitomix flava TaxID=379075 RepID=A0A315ZAB4_SEDFL|nr:hypothetical protein [Sediminitomix flava]PWJ42525.1 hypothetical protein BC781_10268 [Sediminitomix flava]